MGFSGIAGNDPRSEDKARNVCTAFTGQLSANTDCQQALEAEDRHHLLERFDHGYCAGEADGHALRLNLNK
jgi:hypothetical protein